MYKRWQKTQALINKSLQKLYLFDFVLMRHWLQGICSFSFSLFTIKSNFRTFIKITKKINYLFDFDVDKDMNAYIFYRI